MIETFTRSDESQASPSEGWAEWGVTALTAAVIFCRLLTPTEASPLGDTLWIVQLSLLTLLVWVFAGYRSRGFAFRLDWIDGGVCLLAFGPFLAAAVHFSSSDRRSLCNMVWEWCGLWAGWFLVRRLESRPAERRSLTWGLLSVAVALAGLGLWQHYVGLAQTRVEVAKLQAEWDALQARGRPVDLRDAQAWDQSERRLRLEFVRQGIPLEGRARVLWDQRLNASTEPFGTFGLANTFAGWLVAALLLWLGLLAELLRARAPRGGLLGVAGLSALIAFCLLLTKSRTAYVGLAVGLALGLTGLRGARLPSRKIWLYGGLVAAGLAALVGVAAMTGALDRLVVGESFKSLRYRGEYWSGTWRMLTDDSWHWLTGVGPGNFRSYYLQYKLPESSEEIADPHNLVLDVWAGGGLVAVGGLCLFLAAGLLPLVRSCQPALPTAVAPEPARRKASKTGNARRRPDPVVCGAIAAFVGVYLWTFDERMLPLFVVSVLAAAVARPLRRLDLPGSVYAAGFAALAVHLLGAGGIAMPAITQTLLWLAAFGTAGCRTRVWARDSASLATALVCGAAALAIYLGCWFTATSPVMSARAELAAGEQAWYEEGRADKAERAFKRAVEADPLAAEGCEWLGRLYLQRWLATRDAENEMFDGSVYWQRQAILRDPRHFAAYRTLGATYLTRFDRTRAPADASLAADEFARALALYPHHAELQSELAEALWRAEQPDAARSFAERALELDALNRQAGHVDKRLSAARRTLLEKILMLEPTVPKRVDDIGEN